MRRGYKKELLQLIGACVVCVLLIFLNGWYRCKYKNSEDILMTKIPVGDLDGWSCAHVMFFALLGYLFPDMFLEAMIAGGIWEGIEAFLGKSRPSWMGGFGDCDLRTDQVDTTHKNWWYGRVSDLFMNALGFGIGYYVRKNIIFRKSK